MAYQQQKTSFVYNFQKIASRYHKNDAYRKLSEKVHKKHPVH